MLTLQPDAPLDLKGRKIPHYTQVFLIFLRLYITARKNSYHLLSSQICIFLNPFFSSQDAMTIQYFLMALNHSFQVTPILIRQTHSFFPLSLGKQVVKTVRVL